jgi:hypothetical protein
MTRDQAASKIRRNLNDLGITYYSENDLNESIQDGYDEIVVFCECIEARYDVPFVNNTTYYNLRNTVPNYYRIIKIRDIDKNRFLDPASARGENFYRDDWEIVNSDPREFVIAGPDYVGMSGRSSVATGSFTVFYKATAETLGPNSVLRISDKFINLIIDYCTADLLEQNEEYQKAARYWDKYEPALEDYRRKIQLLANSDREFTRSPDASLDYRLS